MDFSAAPICDSVRVPSSNIAKTDDASAKQQEEDWARTRELVLLIGAFTGPLSGNAVLALLDTFGKLWDVSATTVLLTIPVFMFPFATMQIFSGTISDTYDRRTTMMLGFALYAAGGFLAALSPSFAFFMVTRFVQGVGYAFVQPVMLAALSDIVEPGKEGLAMGYYGASTTAGIAVGPLAAGLFAEVDWRLTFVFIGVLASVIIVAMRLALKDERQLRLKTSGRTIVKNLGETIGHREVVLLAVSGFLAFVSFIGIVSFSSEQLGRPPLGQGPSEIGFAIAVSGLLGVVASPYSGRLVDSRGGRLTVLLGFVVSTLAAAALVVARSYLSFVLLLGLLGAGSSFVWAALLTMSVRAYPSLKGTASSIFNSARFFGYALSPIILSPFFTFGDFGTVMVACTILSALGLVAVLLAER